MRSTGFTLIEVVLVVVIIGIVAGIILFSFSGLRDAQILNAGSEEVLSVLAEARAKTLASIYNSSWGVHLESDRITLFRGSSFPGVGDPDNKEVILDPLVHISDIRLAGGATSITFERVTGRTDESGTITLSLVSGSATRIIRLESTGLASLSS